MRISAQLTRPVIAALSPLLAAAALTLMAPATAATAASTVTAATAAKATGPARGSATPAWNYGVDAADQLNTLPVLETGCGGRGQLRASTGTRSDQTHGNYDFGHFLATSKFGNVMLNQKGPGCVYRSG